MTWIFVGREEVPEDPLSKEQIELVAEKLGGDWKRLGTELNFPEDDMNYFESENSEQLACAKKMLTIWQVRKMHSFFFWGSLKCFKNLVLKLSILAWTDINCIFLQENEGDRATAGTLKIALKEVGLPEVIEAVFGSTWEHLIHCSLIVHHLMNILMHCSLIVHHLPNIWTQNSANMNNITSVVS